MLLIIRKTKEEFKEEKLENAAGDSISSNDTTIKKYKDKIMEIYYKLKKQKEKD